MKTIELCGSWAHGTTSIKDFLEERPKGKPGILACIVLTIFFDPIHNTGAQFRIWTVSQNEAAILYAFRRERGFRAPIDAKY